MKFTLSHVLISFTIFAVILAAIVPVYEAPDEPNHLDYINFVASKQHLPNQYKTGEQVPSEGHQAPLYYLVGSALNTLFLKDRVINIQAVPNPAYAANGGRSYVLPLYKHLSDTIFRAHSDKLQFYLLRGFSILLALVNLVFIYKIAQLFFTDKRWQLLTVFFAASLPQLIFISSTINNDNLANLFATLCLYFLFSLYFSPDRRRSFILFGLFLGLGLLTKKTLLFLIPIALIVFGLLLVRLKNKKELPALIRSIVISLVIAGALGSIFFIRNYGLYGELLGTKMELATIVHIMPPRSLFSPYFLSPFLPGLIMSFIGSFSWIVFALPASFYWIYKILFSAAIIGLIIGFYRKKIRLDLGLVLIASVLICLAGIMVYNIHYTQYQGRFLFPVISTIAVLFTYGLKTFLDILPSERVRELVINLSIVAFIVVDIATVLTIHNFYYRLEQYL